jgi:hypothetical protein
MEILQHLPLTVLGAVADAMKQRTSSRSAAVGHEGMHLFAPWSRHRQLGQRRAIKGHFVEPKAGAFEQPDSIRFQCKNEEAPSGGQHRKQRPDDETPLDRGEFCKLNRDPEELHFIGTAEQCRPVSRSGRWVGWGVARGAC